MKRKLSVLLFILLTGILALICFFSGGPKDLDGIMREGRLSVLIEAGEHGFSRDSVKVYGFQYEIIKRFSDSLGVELLLINQENIKNGIDELTKGHCDVFVSLRPVPNDSTLPVLYLSPIMYSRLMLVQKKDLSGNKLIRKQYQLEGDTISLKMNSPYKDVLNNLSEELGLGLSLRETEDLSFDDMVKQVADGKIKYSICPEYLVARLNERYPELDMSLPLSFGQQLSWCVSKESVMLYQKLNLFLDEFVGTTDYWDIYQKYFDKE